MKKTTTTIIITIGIVEVLAFFVAFSPREFDLASFGLINLLFTFLAFIVGLISVLVDKTSEVGKGILIASGIMFIIGISVFSNSKGIG